MRERRSSQRRRLTARLPVLLLALAAALAALLLGSVGVGQAQTAVSLIEVQGGGIPISIGGERASPIETAASAGAAYDGWVVTEVELRIRPDDGTGAIRTATPPGLAICEADSDGDPSGTCFHLTAPGRVQIPAGTTTGQEVTYTAPGYGHFLTTGSNYTLHFTENGSTHPTGLHHLDASDDDGEVTSVAGTFKGRMRELKSDGTWGNSTSSVAWARITGYASETPVESQVNLPTLELASNLGQDIATEEVALGTTRVVQGFTTGPHLYGYTLADIKVKLKNNSASAVTTPVTMSLLDGSLAGNGGPLTGSLVATLTGPSTIPANSTANYSFTAATTVTLDRKATYDVLLEGGTTDIIVKLTASDDEDAAGQRGWSFGDLAYKMTEGQGTIFTEVDDSVLMSVNGAINPTPPRTLVSNIGHTAPDFLALTTFDLAQPFTVGSHDAGYRLTSIDIRVNTGTTGTTTPTLTLHSVSGAGTKVADFTGPSALDANTAKNYTFRPTTSVTLDASDEYWLVVQGSGLVRPETSPSDHEDGTPLDGASIGNAAHSRSASSTGAFTQHDANTPVLKIKVRGVRLDSAATGAPVITAPNVFRVPAVLGVDLSGIADSNGVTNIADSATYTWQRFAANGTTLEAANIGTGDTYTLTDADAGKKVKVSFSFQDDDNYGEGPLTSAATDAITAAAECAAPTYVGGATQLGPARTVGIEQYAIDIVTLYGFVLSTNRGSLDNTTFTTAASNDYEIVSFVDSNTFGLIIEFDTVLSAVDKSTLVLHVCDQAYAFGPITASGNSYHLAASSLGWSTHAERTIYLSEDTVAPTFVEATVNGTSLVMTFNEELGAAASLANGAFTVKKGSGGTTQTLSGSPSISGSTVTLTLATAVTATDTDVKVLYTKPTTGTANKLVDTFGNEAPTFADQDVINALADSVPPELDSDSFEHLVSGDGLTLTLTYNEALKESSVPAAAAFTVKATPAGGSEAVLALASSDAVTVSGSTVVLKLAVPITHNDTSVKVTYTKPGTGAVIEDANGNDAASFTDQPVENFSSAPRVSIERVYADASPGIANPAFRVRRSNMGSTALTVNIGITQAAAYLSSTTQTITIPGGVDSATATFRSSYRGNTSGDLTATVSGGNGYLPAVAPDNSATVRMKVPASGPTVWVSHQHLNVTVNEDGGTADLGVVFSTGAGVVRPRIGLTVGVLTDQGTATINRDYKHISKTLPVGAGDWRAVAGGSYSHTEPIAITIFDDDQYERTDETFIVWLDSTPGVTSVLDVPGRYGPGGSATVTIVDNTPDTLDLSSVKVTSTPTAGYYGATDTIEFTVTFTGNMTVTGAPQFAFGLGGTTHQVAYASGSGSEELVFSHTVVATDGDDHDGISWAANALSLNGGAIKYTHTDPAEQVDAPLDHAAQVALPGHKVEAAKPKFVEASVNGTALTVTFSEDLDTTAAPANSAFTVKKGSGGTAQTLSSTAPSISGATVTLTLATASAVTATDTDVKVAYTKPSANPLKDLSGKEMDTFADQDVINALADSVPPVLNGTPRVLISNIGQVSSAMPSASQSAQPFRTGAHPEGYTVTSIEMQINGSSATIPAITLRSGSASGTMVGTPATPGSAPIAGVLTYTFGTPVPLQASTPYWVRHRGCWDGGSMVGRCRCLDGRHHRQWLDPPRESATMVRRVLRGLGRQCLLQAPRQRRTRRPGRHGRGGAGRRRGDADADLQRAAEDRFCSGGGGVHGEGDARGGQRGGGGAGVQRRGDGERQHGGAEAGGPDHAQRQLGEGELREAGDGRGDRGRERERRRGLHGPGGHQQQHGAAGEHRAGVRRRFVADREPCLPHPALEHGLSEPARGAVPDPDRHLCRPQRYKHRHRVRPNREGVHR